MITPPDISAMFDEINELHFNGKITKIPTNWNSRLRTTAGYCRFKRLKIIYGFDEFIPVKIELNKRLFEKSGYDRAMVYKTLAHEMTHAYLLEHHNEKGHTARFHNIMTRITGIRKNHRCHNYDVEGLVEKKSIVISCPTHGEIGFRKRMPKAGLTYKCKRCKSKVTFYKKTSFKGLFDD